MNVISPMFQVLVIVESTVGCFLCSMAPTRTFKAIEPLVVGAGSTDPPSRLLEMILSETTSSYTTWSLDSVVAPNGDTAPIIIVDLDYALHHRK